MTTTRKKAYLALIITSLTFGIFPVLAKLSFQHVTPLQLMYFRFISIAPISVLLWKKSPHPSSTSLAKMATISCITILNNLVYYIALSHTTVIEGNLISNTSPIIITLASIIFLKEREDRNEWVGLMLAIAGSTIVIVFPFLNALKLNITANVFGNTLMILKVFLSAIEVMLFKKWIKDISIPQLVTITCVNSAITYGIATAYIQPIAIQSMLVPIVLFTVLFMGLFGTYIIYQLQFYGFKHIEASEATLFSYLYPVMYIPLSIILFNERIIPGQIVGLILIVIGVFYAEKRYPQVKLAKDV